MFVDIDVEVICMLLYIHCHGVSLWVFDICHVHAQLIRVQNVSVYLYTYVDSWRFVIQAFY